MNDNIKQDISLLEYPLWMQSTQTVNGNLVTWKDQDGYRFEASRGVPSKVDMLFLYYIMLESQNNNWDQTVRVSRYQILKACGMAPDKEQLDSLIQSLEAWKRVTIAFTGTFYNGVAYEFLEFGIINDWELHGDDKDLEIELNKKWITKIKQSEFFKYLSLVQLKQLRSPLALWLYAILTKIFYKRKTLEIDIEKLAAKIPMSEKYIAHVIPKIEVATESIRDKTDLDVTVKTIKQGKGLGKFIFSGKEKAGSPSVPIPLKFLNLIPEEWRESAIDEASKVLKTAGEDELKGCIAKINQSLKKGIKINSYGDYLRRCHDEKWHKQKNPNEINKAKKYQEQLEQQILKAKHGTVDQIKKEDSDRYAALIQQAADNLGVNPKRPGIGGKMKIRFEVFRILKL